jgi:hypothetical protein
MNNVYTIYIHNMYMYLNVYTMYVHVLTKYVQYLWIHSMKAVFWHIKWITSGTHDATAQV